MIPLSSPSWAQDATVEAPADAPAALSSETVQDPGGVPEGGFLGNDDFGAIPMGTGWEYIWAVYIVTWLALSGYGIYLFLRRKSPGSAQ